MPTRDFSELLKLRNKSFEGAQDIIDKRLAEMYLSSYREAEQQLLVLTESVKGEDDMLVAASKYGRLRKMLDSIGAAYKKLTGKAVDISGKFSAQSYVDAFKSYEWAADQYLGSVPLSFGLPPIEQIRASVFSEASGLTFIKTFRKNMLNELDKIQSVITRGLASGKSYQNIAAELKDAFNNGYNDAVRVVRTEAGRNRTEGTIAADDKARELGINTKRRWSSGMDGRTRSTHGTADGQYADNDNLFTVGGYKFIGPRLPGPGGADPSEIINCRCQVISEIDGIPPKYRRIGRQIVPYQTYSDWATPKGWSPTTGWPKGSEAYIAGLKSLSKRK